MRASNLDHGLNTPGLNTPGLNTPGLNTPGLNATLSLKTSDDFLTLAWVAHGEPWHHDLLMSSMFQALIVDDSPAAREISEASLEAAAESLGVELTIVQAEGGVAALKALATSEVDILLVDLHMPDLHGLEVLAFWRGREQSGPRCAVVISTAVSERDREKALEAGARAFVDKPVSPEVLLPHLDFLIQAGTPESGA